MASLDSSDDAAGMPTPGLSEATYAGLRDLAGAVVGKRPGIPVEPTVLLHEAWLKIADTKDAGAFSSRSHFFAASAQAMRHVLVDLARHAGRLKRGGDHAVITLVSELHGENDAVDVLALSDALDRLRELDTRAARVVDLRFFGGLTTAEIAENLEISERTVRVDWSMARAWLRREFSEEKPAS